MIRPFLLLWITLVGACIGSFLNVVVYRLPRRRSLAYPGSACPACGHAIRPIHNIPVLGWLMLRGRCYDCQSQISFRYPLIEAFVAGLFFLLAFVGPLSANADFTSQLAWQSFAYHGLFLSVLLVLVLIELDGNFEDQVRYPAAMVLGTLLIGIVAPLAQPGIRPIGLLGSFQAGLVGFLFGLAILPAATRGPMGQMGWRFALGNSILIAVFLGLAPAVAVLAFGAMVHAVLSLFSRKRQPVSATVFVAALPILFVWYPPSSSTSFPRHIAALTVAFLVTLAASLASRAASSRPTL